MGRLDGRDRHSRCAVVPVTEYDPHNPFPQFDEQGKQLLPVDWNKRQPKREADLSDLEEALL